MAYFLTAGLVLAATGAALGMTVDHQNEVDHRSGPVAVKYRGDVVITHKQVGAVAPGGRASSLRCDWAASISVARHAVAASGTRLVRSIDSKPVVSGTRPGWCVASHGAIKKEVAAKAADMQQHLMMLAEEDEQMLRVELDRIHGPQRAG
ncbi:hypothetical protein IFR23_11400 [Sphingomonas sp. CFBP 13603]|uniref:hypothetical protein n=1 Tax=Sphingomonas sp. CFBP 13603 TaxID=2774040 RepID=UPI0018693D4B|nr:hypothetical protein [Sphingomonas sp. CFBP 13603]MBE2992622.1 hypothetical protein [Sphingomonas sp. CFBP 13603]